MKREFHKVIVSGATGFIGQHLIPILLKNGYEVIATARDKTKAKEFPWYHDVEFIALDYHQNDTNIPVTRNTGLIHLAWQGLPNYNSLHHFEANLQHNYNFVRSLVSKGVRQVLTAGTCLEYGQCSGLIPATTKPNPDTPYAFAKDSLRRYLEFLVGEMPFICQWARIFYVHGKGQNPNSVLSQLNAAIASGLPVFNMSGGQQLRDYLPVQEAAQQLFDLYNNSRAGTYNICSGNPISIRQLVENRIEELGAPIQPLLGYYPYPAYEPMAFWGERDIGQTLFLPTVPNAPLKSKASEQLLAPVRLRYNKSLDFLENEAFDDTLIKYDSTYDSSNSFSKRYLEHMNEVLEILKKEAQKGGLIVEVGCGKGDFVKLVEQDGYFKIKGFDASYNGKNDAIERRYLCPSDRFEADIVVLRHVLEHIPAPHKFLTMLRSIFGSAKIYIEVPNYNWIVTNAAYFDITYEHVNYFSELALKSLFVHGSYSSSAIFNKQYIYILSDLTSLNTNFELSYDKGAWSYKDFDGLFPSIGFQLDRLQNLAMNKKIFVWGAATKGALFLAHCAARGRLLNQVAFAIDANPEKIGKFLPGSLVEIRSKHDFFKTVEEGDVLIISNPAYQSEISIELDSLKITNVIIETL